MSLNRTVLQNGCVITLDKGLGDFRRADVLIEGSKIAAAPLASMGNWRRQAERDCLGQIRPMFTATRSVMTKYR